MNKSQSAPMIADMHCDTVFRLLQGMDFDDPESVSHVSLPRLIQGGIGLQVFACFLNDQLPPEVKAVRVERMLDALHEMVARYREKIELAISPEEIDTIVASDRIAALFGIENGAAIDNSLDKLRGYYDRGVRIMTLTHNESNDWCVSSGDRDPTFTGLTEFGREVIREMNRLGMIIDISHVAPDSVTAVLEESSAPVVASHSCAYALCAHHRNLTDDQIRDIADHGGLIGVNYVGYFLSPHYRDLTDTIVAEDREMVHRVERTLRTECTAEEFDIAWARVKPTVDAWNTRLSKTGVSYTTVADHVDHIVELVGDDHVGLGSDFDGMLFGPAGLEDCSCLPNLVEELRQRGYSETSLARVLGQNFRRVFGEIWEARERPIPGTEKVDKPLKQ